MYIYIYIYIYMYHIFAKGVDRTNKMAWGGGGWWGLCT